MFGLVIATTAIVCVVAFLTIFMEFSFFNYIVNQSYMDPFLCFNIQKGRFGAFLKSLLSVVTPKS